LAWERTENVSDVVKHGGDLSSEILGMDQKRKEKSVKKRKHYTKTS
jgi:ribosomal protein S1